MEDGDSTPLAYAFQPTVLSPFAVLLCPPFLASGARVGSGGA